MKICIQNSRWYDNSKLRFEWIDIHDGKEEIKAVIEKVGFGSEDQVVMVDFNEVGRYKIIIDKLEEHDDVFELKQTIENYDNLSGLYKKVFNSLVSKGMTFNKAFEVIANEEMVVVLGDGREDLVLNIIENDYIYFPQDHLVIRGDQSGLHNLINLDDLALILECNTHWCLDDVHKVAYCVRKYLYANDEVLSEKIATKKGRKRSVTV